MRNTETAGLPPVWHCPRCGARLVTRNLWHSCVQVTLDELFADAAPGVLEFARDYVALLHSLGDVQVIAQKTRLVCVARVRFAGLTPRKTGFLASFALHRWLDSPRIVKTVDYGPRWRAHHVRIQARDDLDDELRTWLRESYEVVGLQADLAPRTRVDGQVPPRDDVREIPGPPGPSPRPSRRR
jgi:Domain of unknown function (DUF5655)